MATHAEILIVEDSSTQALKLKQTLEQQGFSVRAARDGAEALALLEQAKPTLIVTDIEMPGISGYQLCQKVKSDPRFAEVPVMLLTSLSNPEDVIKGLECGADNFLTKPYDAESLLSRIGSVLANKELRKKLPAASGTEIVFRGQTYKIASTHFQTLDLLFSSFESAVAKNRELERTIRRLKAAQQELREGKETASRTNNASVQRKLHILLVEDSRVNQMVATKTLSKAGHSVVLAENGVEAVAAFAREPFDLILMDVEMPEMNGLEATAVIREKERETGGHIRILAMTAHTGEGDLERCIQAGMDAQLSKPFKLPEFLQTVDELTP